MSLCPPADEPVGARPGAVPVSGRLGAGEAAVVIAAIAAVTVLAALERPIPAVLTALVSAAVLLLVHGRAVRLLAALTSDPGGRG